MKLREAAGEINRAKQVKVLVDLDPEHDEGQLHVRIEKVEAKALLEHCRLHGIDEISAVTEGGILYIESWEDEEDEEEEEGELETEPEPDAGIDPEFDENAG